MKATALIPLFALVLTSVVISDADAARMGGGRSYGAQRSVVPQRVQPAAPAAAPAQAAPNSAAAAPAKAPTPAPAPATGGSRWLGPLAGIAAGLGLAALFSHFGLGGFGADFGGLLLLLAAVVVGFFVFRRFFGRSRASEPAVRAAQPLQFATAGPVPEPAPRSGAEPVFGGGSPRTGQTASPAIVMPPGFDSEPFLRQARSNFNRLQAAYDKGDKDTLADVMTPELYKEVTRDLDQRASQTPTEVVKLDADMVDVATEGDRHWASVRFSGLLREDGEPMPHEFEEVWNLMKPVDDSHGWLLAGIQQVR